MCKTRRDTQVSHPQPTPRSTPTRRYSTTNSSPFLHNPTSSSSNTNAISTTTTSSSSSSSSSTIAATSLTSLRLSLSNNAILYPFSEISTSTRNFRSKPLSSSSSSPSWRSTLRGKQVLILQLPFRRDPATLPSRLSALCKSHHSSLVKLLGAALGGDYIYPVYEFVPGATLRECLRNPRNPDFTPLSKWISRIQVAADLADGLEYIHIHCRTIHNRIKSSTVIVTEPSFNAKICHFGAADLAGEIPEEAAGKMSKEKEEEEEEDEIVNVTRSNSRRMRIDGTRGYIAPEVIGGGRISEKSDVFAFGVVILELVSGREPLKYRMRSGEGGSEYEKESVIETARDAIGTEDEDGASEAEAEERRWRVRRWVDRRLRDSFPVEVAEKLIRVALRCVEEERFMRPEMTWVAGMVSKLLLESKVWAERVTLPTDFSVTVGPR